MRRTKEEALATRESLVDAALEVFLEKGYASSSLQDIANKAGLTRGAVYWHFKGKGDLYLALYKREHDFIIQLIDKILVEEKEADDKLYFLLNSIINNYYTNTRFQKYIELTWFKTESAFFHYINNRKSSTSEYILSELESLATTAITNQQLRADLDPKSIAKNILIYINGIYRLRFTAPKNYSNLEEALANAKNYLDVLLRN